MTEKTVFVVQYASDLTPYWGQWREVQTAEEAADVLMESRSVFQGRWRIIQRTITETELPPPAET